MGHEQKITLRTLMKNKIFITCLLIPYLEPRSIQELITYGNSSIWSVISNIFSLFKLMSLSVIILLIIITQKGKFKISKISILIIAYEAWIILVNYINGYEIFARIQWALLIIGLVLLTELYLNMNLFSEFVRCLSFWLGILIVANLVTMILYPNGMYVDNNGWTENFLFSFKNMHIYMFLPYLAAKPLADLLKEGKLSWSFYVMVGVIFVSAYIANSTTTLVAMIVLFICILFFRESKSRIVNPIFWFIGSVVLSIFIIVFNVQSYFATSLEALFQKPIGTFHNRTYIWDLALNYFAKNPIIGNGYLSFYASFSKNLITQMHNQYLDVLIIGGAFLGILFGIIIFSACKKISKRHGLICSNLLSFSLICYFILFLTEAYRNNVLIFFVIVAAYHIDKVAPIVRREQQKKKRFRLKI